MSSIIPYQQTLDPITSRSDSCCSAHDADEANRPLRIYVLHSDPRFTAPALGAASTLAADLRADVVLLAVREIPYPLPVDRPNFHPELYLAQLRAIAADIACPIRIELILAREKTDALRRYLRPGSLVLIATRKRWLKTREEKLARNLQRMACNVSLLTLKMSRTGVVADRLSQPAKTGINHARPKEVTRA